MTSIACSLKRISSGLAESPWPTSSTTRAPQVGRIAEQLEEVVVLSHEAEQEVLGADLLVPQRPRLVLREHDHLTSVLGEALEHGRPARQVRSAGKRITSRIERRSASSITRRSMPRPTPPVGGMP